MASSPRHRPGEDAHSHGHHDAISGADVTELMAAAHEGDLVHVLKLVSQGVNLDITDDLGRTAIQFAACSGHVNVVKELIDRGCDIHKASLIGRTPLMSAAANGHESVVAYVCLVYSVCLVLVELVLFFLRTSSQGRLT